MNTLWFALGFAAGEIADPDVQVLVVALVTIMIILAHGPFKDEVGTDHKEKKGGRRS